MAPLIKATQDFPDGEWGKLLYEILEGARSISNDVNSSRACTWFSPSPPESAKTRASRNFVVAGEQVALCQLLALS